MGGSPTYAYPNSASPVRSERVAYRVCTGSRSCSHATGIAASAAQLAPTGPLRSCLPVELPFASRAGPVRRQSLARRNSRRYEVTSRSLAAHSCKRFPSLRRHPRNPWIRRLHGRNRHHSYVHVRQPLARCQNRERARRSCTHSRSTCFGSCRCSPCGRRVGNAHLGSVGVVVHTPETSTGRLR